MLTSHRLPPHRALRAVYDLTGGRTRRFLLTVPWPTEPRFDWVQRVMMSQVTAPIGEQVQLIWLDSLAAARPIWWTVTRFRPRGKEGAGLGGQVVMGNEGSYWSGVWDEQREKTNLGSMWRNILDSFPTEPLFRVYGCFQFINHYLHLLHTFQGIQIA